MARGTGQGRGKGSGSRDTGASGRTARRPAASGKPTGKAGGRAGAKAGGKAAARTAAKTGARRAPAAGGEADAGRLPLILGAILVAVAALRLAVLALEPMPVHFDEAQYWAYGEELAWGHFSKPPGVGAVIRASTELLGDTLFGLRATAPLAHAAIAWLIFLAGRRLFDTRTGFWAALGYTAAPGVSVSAMIVSTDPVMMVAWAFALYALVRAGETGARGWWAALGLAIGLGFLAKYTMLVFAAGALAWGLFSARGRDLAGTAVAGATALAVMAPNLLWNAANGFATVAHVADDADPGGERFNPGTLAEFLGAQLGVIGPVFFLAILASLWRTRTLARDPGVALVAWQTYALLVPIAVLAFVTRAQPNWAAPAYVAGSILAAHWLLSRDWRRALAWGQVGLGAVAALAVYGLAAVYANRAGDLPRTLDPFKKMRLSEPFCERALGVMSELGVEVLLSDSRRRLSECMFYGGLGWDRVAVWNPDMLPDNHHELVATLQPGDDRPMLLAVLREDAGHITRHFAEVEEIEQGAIRTHADATFPYGFWLVRGFEGYGRTY